MRGNEKNRRPVDEVDGLLGVVPYRSLTATKVTIYNNERGGGDRRAPKKAYRYLVRWIHSTRSVYHQPLDHLSVFWVSLPSPVSINSLCAKVEREVHVANVPEVFEDVPHVFRASPEGKIANQERHLARGPTVSPTFTGVFPAVPSPVTVAAHVYGARVVGVDACEFE